MCAHLLRHDAATLHHGGLHLEQLLGARCDDKYGHPLHPLLTQRHDARHEGCLAPHHLDAMVGHHLARVARARVEEARHLELDRAVSRCEVGELGLPTYGARQAEDAPVLVEDVRRADRREGALRNRQVVL